MDFMSVEKARDVAKKAREDRVKLTMKTAIEEGQIYVKIYTSDLDTDIVDFLKSLGYVIFNYNIEISIISWEQPKMTTESLSSM